MPIELAFIELYNSRIHGDTNLNGTFLVTHLMETTNINELLEEYSINIRRSLFYFWRCHYSRAHDIIRNIFNINAHGYFTSVRFIEVYENEYGGEILAIDKTCYVKFLQRKWKNIVKKRKEIIKKRCNPRELFKHQITGKWSNKY